MHKKSFDGFEMTINIIQHLVPRLGHNTLAHDPATLVTSLKPSSSGSQKIFHSKAQEIEDMLNFLKGDYVPHKLILRCFEQLHSTINYRHAVTILLISMRHHIKKHGDTRDNFHHHDSTIFTY